MDGRDDLAGGVTAEDNPTCGHVLLHGSPQGVLGILGQSVHLCEHNNCRERGYIVYPPLAVVVLTSCVSFSLSDNDGVCLISMQSALQCSVNWLHIRTKKI